MIGTEVPVCFSCAGDPLVGIVHRPDDPGNIGVVIVVGGPQYRIGAHRQFLVLARALAEIGIPVLRFDVRGMGDSGGEFPGFEALDDDIAAAIDAFTATVPEVDRVVLWGLCDGASASLFYAHRDPRVAGLVLLNPWIRTEATYARTELRHYYTGKLGDPRFWRRLVTGDVDLMDAGRSLWQRVCRLSWSNGGTAVPSRDDCPVDSAAPLPDRMAQGLAAFDGPVLLIMSGNDLTAREFDDVTRSSPPWVSVLSQDRLTRRDLKEADHTFSRAGWTESVNGWTGEWILELSAHPPATTARQVRTA